VAEDVMADYLAVDDSVPEREAEPENRRRPRRCVPLKSPWPVVVPPFLGGPETTTLLSDYARHVTIPL